MNLGRLSILFAGFVSIVSSATLLVYFASHAGFLRGEYVSLGEALRRRAALDRVHELLQKRLADKQRTTDSLIAGRLRFAEAVTEFRTINEAGGSELTFSMPRHPNDTVYVISARNVAYWAISMLRFHHADEMALAQVSKDLHDYLGTYYAGIEN